MNPFFPFIYQKPKKENFEQISLYIDDYVPELIPIEKEEENLTPDTVIIINNFD